MPGRTPHDPQDCDVVFWSRMTFRRDTWKGCRKTANSGAFVVREGYPKYLCDRVFRDFEYQKDDGDNDFIEPDMRSASTSDVSCLQDSL